MVIRFAYYKNKKSYWICQCECGREHINTYGNLKYGHTKSCGCLHKEVATRVSTKHGDSKTSFYKKWAMIKERCEYNGADSYHLYGARGIKCNWKSYEDFKDDMYASYSKHIKKFGKKQTTLDRIDVNGNYELSNCRWATLKEQANNKRNNHYVIYNNECCTAREFAEKFDMNYSTLMTRLSRKWSVEKILSKHLKNKKCII